MGGRKPAARTISSSSPATFGSPDSPEGDPLADPDGDGASNQLEFLAGTLANGSGSFPVTRVTRSGTEVSLNFPVPENRSVRVQTSTNLRDWSLWDIPGNDGIPLPAGDASFHGPMVDGGRFFRALYIER